MDFIIGKPIEVNFYQLTFIPAWKGEHEAKPLDSKYLILYEHEQNGRLPPAYFPRSNFNKDGFSKVHSFLSGTYSFFSKFSNFYKLKKFLFLQTNSI